METAEILTSRRAFKSPHIGKEFALTKKEAESVALALENTRKRMGQFYQANQILGRRETIGCVALEITQRCNLDCTLCYLSDHSENVKDLPLQEILRRVDEIYETYGPGVVIQVTGGDPTLRDRDELVRIVQYIREKGLQPALFTNGIKATRELLERLVKVGLMDVAFHVDLTQERKGYSTEVELNEIRKEYIERARGLPITCIFNHSIYQDNFSEIPELVRLYRQHADVVHMASFQLQADTGRGELTKRAHVISIETVREQINKGADIPLNWDPVMIGHPKCHGFAPSFAINGNLHAVLDDPKLIADAMDDFKHVFFDRRKGVFANAIPYLRAAARKPQWIWRLVAFAVPRLWRARKDLIAARGKVDRLSFFIHNFMDADNLEAERVDACSFMVMTPEGPMSMCAHNARRDEFILKPIEIQTENGTEIWNPLRDKVPNQRKARGQRSLKTLPTPSNGTGCGGGCSC